MKFMFVPKKTLPIHVTSILRSLYMLLRCHTLPENAAWSLVLAKTKHTKSFINFLFTDNRTFYDFLVENSIFIVFHIKTTKSEEYNK